MVELKGSVVLEFYLDEKVTPEIFARKIATGCARSGAIRIGERVVSGIHVYEYVGDVEVDVLGNNRPILVPEIKQIHP